MENILMFIASLAFGLAFTSLFFFYGKKEYHRGVLDGFNQCSIISMDAMEKMAMSYEQGEPRELTRSEKARIAVQKEHNKK